MTMDALKRYTYLLRFAGILAAALCILVFLEIPFFMHVVARIGESIDNREAIRNAGQWEKIKAEWTQKNRTLGADLQKQVHAVPKDKRVSAIYDLVKRPAQAAGITLSSMQVYDELQHGNRLEIPVRIKINGPFNPIARFLSLLERGEGIVNITETAIKADVRKGAFVSADISLSFWMMKEKP